MLFVLAAVATYQDMFVYQLLQSQIPRNSGAVTAHCLRSFVARQADLETQPDALVRGGIVKKPADEGGPQSAADVPREHLKDAHEDEQKPEETAPR